MTRVFTQKRFYIPKHKKTEENIQRRVANYLKRNYPGVDFHSDYAAGLHLTENQAKIRKILNSGRGWADMFIPYPTDKYHGLFLELKKDGTAIMVTRGPRKGLLVKNEQIQVEYEFLKRMEKLGYCARFAVGFENATALIDGYFGRLNGSLF